MSNRDSVKFQKNFLILLGNNELFSIIGGVYTPYTHVPPTFAGPVHIDMVRVSFSIDNNVPIERYGLVLIYWNELIYEGKAYYMPPLDSILLGLKLLLTMKPDFHWNKSSLKHGILSYTHKRYRINFNKIEKVIGSDDAVEYFAKEHGVKIHVTNEGGSKMLLIICAIRLDVDIDQVAKTVLHFAPSLKSI